MKNFKKKEGITLVALVVTIVILLILAGVSINMVLGENGLIAKAKEAKNAYEQDVKNTEKGFAELYDELQTNIGEFPSTEYTKPYLPTGFTRVEGTGLSNGLVIQDSTGNQYVWVEVPKTEEVYPTAGLAITNFTDEEYTKIENDLHIYTSVYRNNTSYKDEYYSDLITGLTEIQYNELKKKMLKSVYENGGFWIGKYEAGIETARTDSSDTIEDNLIPTSKANKYPLNYVKCSQAQTLASRVSPTGRTSSLMFGVQWDLVLKYLETKGVTREELKGTITGSTNWGNYVNASFDITNISVKYAIFNMQYGLGNWNSVSTKYTKPSNGMVLLTTGSNEKRNSKQNICDLAGNVWEWTLEYTSNPDKPCASRGGGYDNWGYKHPVAFRNDDQSPIRSTDIFGFRVSFF